VAVYADAEVPYGKVVEVLNIGAENSIKMVLATKPSSPQPAASAPSLPEQDMQQQPINNIQQ